ncbi:hypothetical protein AVEN_49332-1 [Araneus ventricosus]|uniref:Uncharacterized protein n=1 Tax=Araneus ventricosus TaxID=182803 RepID=A0A4Y2HA92_ARAVE|nr:hypothetical protein AVEN_49332-1 [Araneus ventricosus]
MKESVDEDFGSFQQEKEAVKMEEVLKKKDVEGDVRIMTDYSYVCGIQEFDDGEYDITGLRRTNLTKLKFVSAVNDQFTISESYVNAILPGRISSIDCRKELFGF